MQDLAESCCPSRSKACFGPWFISLAASLFFFYEFIQGNMFASIADNIMRDFHIQADKMTYLSSSYYVSNVLFLFIAGLMLDRFSAKKTILWAMLLCVLSTFVLAYSHSFYVALGCRLITGVGSAFCFLGPIRIASRWFPPKRMAMVTGIIVTMAMSGGMLAQYPLAQLVAHVGWREALLFLGWLGAGMWFFMYGIIQDHPKDVVVSHVHESVGFLKALQKAYLSLQMVCAGLYTSLMNMSVAVFGAMMGSLYLMQRLGITKEHAALINSMLFLGAIVGGPLSGWYSDKLGLRILPMKMGALFSLSTFLIILYVPVSVGMMGFLFFCLGLFTAAQVIGYAFVAESSSPAVTGMAISIVSILTQGGYIVYQNLFSRLLLWHGDMQVIRGVPTYSFENYQTAALIIPFGLLIALCTLFKLKETHCRHIQG